MRGAWVQQIPHQNEILCVKSNPNPTTTFPGPVHDFLAGLLVSF